MEYGPEIDPDVSETSLKPSIPSIVDLHSWKLKILNLNLYMLNGYKLWRFNLNIQNFKWIY